MAARRSFALAASLAFLSGGVRRFGDAGARRSRRRRDHGGLVRLPRERPAGRDLLAGDRGCRLPGRTRGRARTARARHARAARGPGGVRPGVLGQRAPVPGRRRLDLAGSRDQPRAVRRTPGGAGRHRPRCVTRGGSERVRGDAGDRAAVRAADPERPGAGLPASWSSADRPNASDDRSASPVSSGCTGSRSATCSATSTPEDNAPSPPWRRGPWTSRCCSRATPRST